MKIKDIIICTENPEWGTWVIIENHEYGFVIRGDRGSRVLSHGESDRFWAKCDWRGRVTV